MKILNEKNLHNIQEGQVFKSVNELIKYLGLNNNHKLNKEEKERIELYMKNYVEYESTNNTKRKNEIVITKVQRDLLIEPMEDNRIDKLEAEVVGYMIASSIKAFGKDKYFVFFSKGFLYLSCQMCNEKWNECKFDSKAIKELSEDLEIDKDYIYQYFDLTNKVFNTNLNKGIKYLKNRRLVKDKESYAVKQNGKHRRVTEKEETIILKYEHDILNYWGLTYQDIWKKKKYKQFREHVLKLIKQEIEKGNKEVQSLEGIEYYYEAIIFTYDYDNIVKALKQLKTVTKRQASKVSNDNVKEVIDKEASKKSYREGRKYKKDMNKLINETIKDKSSEAKENKKNDKK